MARKKIITKYNSPLYGNYARLLLLFDTIENMIKRVILIKAFTKDPQQGNPAGVVLDADHLTYDQMINIADRLGFSESAFVQKSEVADYKIRFFTSTQEVDLCGHATIATFHALVQSKIITFPSADSVHRLQETRAGVLPVTCSPDGLIMMNLTKPHFFESESSRRTIAELLSLREDDLLDYPIQSVSVGTPKLMIAVKSLNRLFAIKPDLEGIIKYSKEKKTRGFYPFTPETKDKDSDFHARLFNPLAGVNEDPITGVAAGALACYAKRYGISNKNSFIIEQGYIMGKSGKILIDVSTGVKVGGYAVEFGQEEIEL